MERQADLEIFAEGSKQLDIVAGMAGSRSTRGYKGDDDVCIEEMHKAVDQLHVMIRILRGRIVR